MSFVNYYFFAYYFHMNIKNTFLFGLILLLNACSDAQLTMKPKPSEIALNYAELKFVGDDSYIEFLTEEEKFYAIKFKDISDEALEENLVITSIQNVANQFQKDNLEVSLIDELISDNSASITLQITTIDVETIVQEMFADVWKRVLSGEFEISNEFYQNLFTEKLENNPKLKNEIITLELIENSETWQVKDGWKEAYNTYLEEIEIRDQIAREEIAKIEADSKISSLIKEARELERKKDYAQASTKVVSALNIDPTNEDAVEYSAKLEEIIAKEKAIQDYIPNVEIIDFNARYFDSYSYGKVPGVQFGVKNNGNKSLKRVEIIVYFYDDNGNAIYEENYVPISEYSYDGLSELKPNYIERMEKDKFYRVKGLGAEWSGKANAVISEIEFSE